MRVGFGYDVHRLVEERKLILGGVEIPYEKGLLGHSDADVLTHAVMDALLGAGAFGDIGQHFPDNDQSFKDIDSLLLLEKVAQVVARGGYRVNNIDATIVAQKPKLAPYRAQMAENIAKCLQIETSRVSIKATTTEGLGFAGTGEGMAAYAVCTLAEGGE